MRPIVLLVALSFLLVACGDGTGGGGRPTVERWNDKAEGAPAGPLPTVDGPVDAPPAAWIETTEDARWMAFGSFCWDNGCVDMLSPSQIPGAPHVVVSRGETVLFHLGFEPSEVMLPFAGEPGRDIALPPRRDVSWDAARGGFAVLTAWREGGGSGSYVVELIVEGGKDTAAATTSDEPIDSDGG